MNYHAYINIICIIVFVVLVIFTGTTISWILRLKKKLVEEGVHDYDIVDEFIYNRKEVQHRNRLWNIIHWVVGGILILIFILFLLTGLFSSTKVVQSDSMKPEFATFDVIFIEKIPEKIEIGDIVVYRFEENGQVYHIIHRVIAQNDEGFRTKGDAVQVADKKIVKFSQIEGIYRGQKIKYIGSFIMFMQSPSGWLCLLLVVFMTWFSPWLSQKEDRWREKRYDLISHYYERTIKGGKKCDTKL